ncbi:transcription factor TFIIIB subunit brf1 [Ceratobasidium sp. 395]|nr:transcription factor TFIIIB subunit brf1 [Ceratobasidium sp. 395]
MLIDFSDLLRVNVFVLGAYYLKLVRELNISLPLIDPAHLIARFAALLEFGEETNKVVIDATRLVSRFSRDWMTHGRRPAGICGACLLLAARMNHFRRSIQEIVQVVKIGDETVKKRLDEFKATPSAALTMHDFRNVMLEEAADPPAFTRGLEKMREGAEGKRNGKRKREEEEEEDAGDAAESAESARQPVDMTKGIVSLGLDEQPNENQTRPLFYPSDDEEQAAFDEIVGSQQPPGEEVLEKDEGKNNKEDEEIEAEVSEFLDDPNSSKLAAALEDAEQQRLSQLEVIDELQGLDEEELDGFLLTPEEVQKKTRMWVEFNRDYLEKIAMKGLDTEEGQEHKRQKSRKARKRQKPRDSTTANGETPAQSARALMQRKKTFSRRINYAAVEKLFEEPSVKNKGKKSANEPVDDADGEDKDEGGEKYDDEGAGDVGEMDYYDDGYQEEV